MTDTCGLEIAPPPNLQRNVGMEPIHLPHVNLQILGYGTFYDVPRGMFVRVGSRVAHLQCEFDEKVDDYEDFYTVSYVVDVSTDDFYTGRYFHNHYDEIVVGRLPLQDVTFDATRRKSIRSSNLESLMARIPDEIA